MKLTVEGTAAIRSFIARERAELDSMEADLGDDSTTPAGDYVHLTQEELATVARLRRIDEGYSVRDAYADFGSGVAKQKQHDADLETAAEILLRLLPEDCGEAADTPLRLPTHRAANITNEQAAAVERMRKHESVVGTDVRESPYWKLTRRSSSSHDLYMEDVFTLKDMALADYATSVPAHLEPTSEAG